jgi:hypothetical protein
VSDDPQVNPAASNQPQLPESQQPAGGPQPSIGAQDTGGLPPGFSPEMLVDWAEKARKPDWAGAMHRGYKAKIEQ